MSLWTSTKSLASIERLKVVALNLITLLVLLPNARIFQEFLAFLGYHAFTVPMGTVLAGLYVFLALLAKILAPHFPATSIRALSRPERVLFFTLLYIVGSVLFMHTMLRPLTLPLGEETIRAFVRLLVGPLTCLLFVGRWHRVRPWPFLLVLGTTGLLLILEVVATETTLKISNVVRLIMMGSKEISIIKGLRFENQLFFGLYSEPSHAFLSLFLCLGGLLLCWRRSLIRLRTLLLGMGIFFAALAVGVSRTAYLSLFFGLALSALLGLPHAARPERLNKLPSKLRRFLPAIVATVTVALGVGGAALTLLLLASSSTYASYATVETDQDGSPLLLSGRRATAFETLYTMLTDGVASMNVIDAASAGRFSQAWIGYSQPLISPFGSKVGTASKYVYSLHIAPAREEFEYNRIYSHAMSVTHANKMPDTREEAALAAHRHRIFSIRSYGALLCFYNGIFGWLAILLLVGRYLLHPDFLRTARAETILTTVAAIAALTIVTFSVPTLPGAWPLIALPGYLAKAHSADTRALEGQLQQGNRQHAPPQPQTPTNLRPIA